MESTIPEICQKVQQENYHLQFIQKHRYIEVALLQIADKQKLTFSKQASSCTDTLLCLEDHLLSGGPDDLVSTFQPDAVIPADSILYLKIVL